MNGNYSLTDLSSLLGLSKAAIDKYATFFGIESGASGQRGLKSEYRRQEYLFFKRVNYLRLLGFSLEEIKEYRQEELKIFNLVNNCFDPSSNKEIKVAHKLHNANSDINMKGTIPIFLITDIYFSSIDAIYIDNSKFYQGLSDNKKEAIELKSLLDRRAQRLTHVISNSKEALTKIVEQEKRIKEGLIEIQNVFGISTHQNSFMKGSA